MRNTLTIFFALFCYNLLAQDSTIEKVILDFNYFKHYDTQYTIDFNKNKVFCVMKHKIPKNKEKILSIKIYSFTSQQVTKFKKELNQNIPDSIIHKSESALDGGGFVISYFKKDGTTSKLSTRNISIKPKKYKAEFNLIDSFFEFIYSVVDDDEGLKILDESYEPYFYGLPIRKVSENPLEYKVWGSINGDVTWNNQLTPFLDGLPKNQCIIIDCDNQLSYSWQEDILRLYILKNSTIQFANMDWLKYTREYLIEFKEKLKTFKDNEEEMKKLKKTTTYDLYMNNTTEINKWLELPKNSILKTVEQCRENCR